jgi:hypothetical protein
MKGQEPSAKFIETEESGDDQGNDTNHGFTPLGFL